MNAFFDSSALAKRYVDEPGSERVSEILRSASALGVSILTPTEIVSAPYQAIRLTDKKSVDRLRQIGGIRILIRGDGALVALFENKYRLQRLMSDEPELTLEPILASGESA